MATTNSLLVLPATVNTFCVTSFLHDKTSTAVYDNHLTTTYCLSVPMHLLITAF